ncbi:hypothetical protein ACIPL1_09815 [Pseudomonas sp. NPDC090202]|uniref:hypothetical protein n=1 Tax=unclassified Pseudomonas TaxID=196821 RepID=UPI0038252B11
MAWNRRSPEVAQAPMPPSMARWSVALVIAVLIGVLLFLLYAALPSLQVLNVWLLCASPVVAVGLAFAGRAYGHGGALSRFESQQATAREAQDAWQRWGQRGMAVLGTCLLLPDQVSASSVAQGGQALPPRTGQARRLDGLPAKCDARVQAGIDQLLATLAASLTVLPAAQTLNVTLLTDIPPADYPAAQAHWQQGWARLKTPLEPARVSLAAALSPHWIEETLKTASTAVELIVVLQVNGEAAYSDGLAALLLCPDALAEKHAWSRTATWLRPMPLQAGPLEQEFALFLQTQASAREATGLLADRADWLPLNGRLLAASTGEGALEPTAQTITETLSGVPGPLGHWLVAVLGIELTRHRQQPLLLLTQDGTQHWISTITTKESV